MSEKNEVQIQQPAEMIMAAVKADTDLDKLEKLLELQMKWEENEARKAYHKSMALFKADPPDIYKDKKNLQFGSRYTSLDNLVNVTIPRLGKYGFSHKWNYGKLENGNPSVTCILTHELGHSDSVTQDAPPIQSKNKAGQIVTNPIQQVKATQTYLKITTFEAITGLVSKESNCDDDGNAMTDVESVSDKQLHNLRDLIISAEVSEEPICKFFKIEKLEDLPKAQYQKALTIIEARKAEKEKDC